MCFHEYSIPLNATQQWSNSGCTIFVDIEKNGTFPLPLRNVQYKMAYFPKTAGTNPEVTIMITGDECTTLGEIYDDQDDDCVVPTLLHPGVTNITMDENVQFFYFDSGMLVGSITLTEEDIGEPPSSTVNFYIRRVGAPSELNNDYHGMSPIQINYPLLGRYFIRLNTTRHGPKSIKLAIESCEATPGKAGPGCAIEYGQTTTLMLLKRLTQSYSYFQVNVSTESKFMLWVSVRSTNGSAPTIPSIYASLGQLPLEGNADISGCNQGACGAVNAIQFNNTANTNQTWFVAVSGVNDTEYGIWINSLCAPNCDDHGECTQTGLQAGVCECVADFIGVDCGKTNGLGAQYIVLIIIASLVVASAVIGFIAWAYMRRKRVDYEHVS